MARVLVFSGGGIKAAVAAARYAADHELILLHTDYGQAGAPLEFDALEQLAASFPRARAIRIPLPDIARLRESTGPASGSRGALSPVVLQGQFCVILAAGIQQALREGSTLLVTGLSSKCSAAHLGLPGVESASDTLREFLHAYQVMTEVLHPAGKPLQITSPLIDLTYPEILKLGHRLGVPFEKTRTCLSRRAAPCFRCDPCRRRAEAFREIGRPDPLQSTAPQVAET